MGRLNNALNGAFDETLNGVWMEIRTEVSRELAREPNGAVHITVTIEIDQQGKNAISIRYHVGEKKQRIAKISKAN